VSSASIDLQAAYLLHYKLYGDTNFIVDLFTLNHGRVSLLAKGARSSKPRTRTLYQPFRPLLVSWWGDGDLRTLTGIEESGSALTLVGSALPCGYYLNEIILRLLAKDQPQQNLFAHYVMALTELSENPDNPAPTLRRFELQLLEALGSLPDFAASDRDGEAIDEQRHYLYYPSAVQAIAVDNDDQYIAIPKEKPLPVIYHADGETPETGIPVSGRTLLRMASFEIEDKQVLAEMKPLMRRILHLHLGDRPLNSREMFSSLTPPPPKTNPVTENGE